MSRVYTQWKQSWHIEQRVHEQKHRALLFWALQLQKKVLHPRLVSVRLSLVFSVFSIG